MKLFIAIAVCAGVANGLPLLQPAVTNGVLLEESARTPTFAKGIRTDCNYEDVDDRDLGHVFAKGDSTIYKAKDASAEAEEDAKLEAKTACDDMGPDCGGVVRNSDGEYQLFHGTVLKKKGGSKTFLKEICAFPLPYSNFWKGDNMNDHSSKNYNDDHTKQGAPTYSQPPDDGLGNSPPQRDMGSGKVFKFNHGTNPNVERMRWKLSNGPSYNRIDDGKDHGSKSRLSDGKYESQSVEDCMKECAKRTDCMSGHYCANGEGVMAGKCFLSGDWDPYGVDQEFDGCNEYNNFRQTHEWVKPVLKLENGDYVKEQWHDKVPIDVAYAQQAQGY